MSSTACYYPVTLYKSRLGPSKETGKWPLVGLKDGYRDLKQKVPCGRCIGCRLERSRQWAIRCMNEASMHDSNSFVTLTYNDESLVFGDKEKPTLNPRDLQLFMKRLRKEYDEQRIRFFACGEYGERTNRPHYHACLFGIDFEDKKFHSSKGGNNLYVSRNLDSLWGLGHTAIGDVTFESAAYVARYIMDKKLGKSGQYYLDEGIEPEFVRMSRRPGIGASYLDKYYSDIFPSDFIVIRNGVKCKPPKYYSNRFNFVNPIDFKYDFSDVLEHRKDEGAKHWRENTEPRLRVRERVKEAQIRSLKR